MLSSPTPKVAAIRVTTTRFDGTVTRVAIGRSVRWARVDPSRCSPAPRYLHCPSLGCAGHGSQGRARSISLCGHRSRSRGDCGFIWSTLFRYTHREQLVTSTEPSRRFFRGSLLSDPSHHILAHPSVTIQAPLVAVFSGPAPRERPLHRPCDERFPRRSRNSAGRIGKDVCCRYR